MGRKSALIDYDNCRFSVEHEELVVRGCRDSIADELLDDNPAHWRKLFEEDQASGSPPADYDRWLERMRGYVQVGRTFDLQENEDMIRCVAAPVRDASGSIVAALSVSSAAQYMADDRMESLSADVLATAGAISSDLGWSPEIARKSAKRTRG